MFIFFNMKADATRAHKANAAGEKLQPRDPPACTTPVRRTRSAARMKRFGSAGAGKLFSALNHHGSFALDDTADASLLADATDATDAEGGEGAEGKGEELGRKSLRKASAGPPYSPSQETAMAEAAAAAAAAASAAWAAAGDAAEREGSMAKALSLARDALAEKAAEVLNRSGPRVQKL